MRTRAAVTLVLALVFCALACASGSSSASASGSSSASSSSSSPMPTASSASVSAASSASGSASAASASDVCSCCGESADCHAAVATAGPFQPAVPGVRADASLPSACRPEVPSAAGGAAEPVPKTLSELSLLRI